MEGDALVLETMVELAAEYALTAIEVTWLCCMICFAHLARH